MKLSLLFLLFGFLLVLLQTTFLHLFPLDPVVPDLILVLCVYWGLNHPTVGAVLGSFILGYSVDVFSSPVLGLNAFAMSLVFLAVYLSSRCIWIHNSLLSAGVVFFASWIKGVALIIAWNLFLTGDGPWMGFLKYVFLEALIAAILAPALFSLLRRGQNYLETARMPV
ncbi:MAG TPA: rod shape-determining protein MreD [Candidatus Binatia bacterium]|jgi:rod shape-determining protein MreD|nr:rod shape-determining protein MreD [Candidatus Binatia bacterium]